MAENEIRMKIRSRSASRRGELGQVDLPKCSSAMWARGARPRRQWPGPISAPWGAQNRVWAFLIPARKACPLVLIGPPSPPPSSLVDCDRSRPRARRSPERPAPGGRGAQPQIESIGNALRHPDQGIATKAGPRNSPSPRAN